MDLDHILRSHEEKRRELSRQEEREQSERERRKQWALKALENRIKPPLEHVAGRVSKEPYGHSATVKEKGKTTPTLELQFTPYGNKSDVDSGSTGKFTVNLIYDEGAYVVGVSSNPGLPDEPRYSPTTPLDDLDHDWLIDRASAFVDQALNREVS